MLTLAAFIVLNLQVPHPPAGRDTSTCRGVNIVSRLVSWGHEETLRPRSVEAIIIHSSYNALGPDSFSLEGILKEYRAIGVSPHYIIDRSGTIFRLVPEADIAYHAGRSRLPDGTTAVNRASIGIELINTPTDGPTRAQYLSLVGLVKCLQKRYHIRYILGHSDIAPGRKTDPWNFDWKKFNGMLKGS